MIEGVSRERWRRALASLVGYVGDFDLAEESTQKAFAITLRLPATTSEPTGLPGPRSRRYARYRHQHQPRPTAGPPRTSSHSNRPPPRPGHRRRDRAMRRPPPSPVNRPPFAIASGTLAVELVHPHCARIGRLERRARRARHREPAPGPEIRATRDSGRSEAEYRRASKGGRPRLCVQVLCECAQLPLCRAAVSPHRAMAQTGRI